ncbi:MAG: FecR domain-containing protein [Blastocatellia bacterium]|nr:FecR domain-containing protein [Blastocatellia bacterium]
MDLKKNKRPLTSDWFIIPKKTINRVIGSIIAVVLFLVSGFLLKMYLESRPKIEVDSRAAKFIKVEGRVSIKKASSGVTETVNLDTLLESEDTIQTGGDSYAIVQYADGSIYNIKSDSTIIFKETYESKDKEEKRVASKITIGTISVRTTPESGSHTVSLSNTTADINKDSDATLSSDGVKDTIQVLSGSVKAQTPKGTELISTDERLEIVKDGNKRSKLPPSPALKSPQNGTKFLLKNREEIELAWEPIADAQYYRVMVSPVYSFPIKSLSLDKQQITDTKFKWANPIEGSYYWRVQAITRDGVEGKWSDTPSFEVKIQKQFKEIPVKITKTTEINFFLIEIEGVTNPGGLVSINDRPQIQADSSGYFKADVSFPPGTRIRKLQIEVVDANGNKGQLIKEL